MANSGFAFERRGYNPGEGLLPWDSPHIFLSLIVLAVPVKLFTLQPEGSWSKLQVCLLFLLSDILLSVLYANEDHDL